MMLRLLMMMMIFLVGCGHAAVMTNAKKRPLFDETKCPLVKPMRNFNLNKVLGFWVVQQFYASEEEALSYSCMRASLDMSVTRMGMDVHMVFNYSYIDDPQHDVLQGNISWTLPELRQPAHWLHAEDTYEGVYNTYVLDTDYASWLVLLHCAEKELTPRYLSALVLSRTPESLNKAVKSYLQDKLAKYGVDVEYLFTMQQQDCPERRTTEKIAGAPFKRA